MPVCWGRTTSTSTAQLNEATWKLIADTGGKITIAPAIEMQMRHGMPPFQTALDHGIRPSLSVDVECNMAADMFSIMRAAFTLQRALANQRAIGGEKNAPRLPTARHTIELATIEGARVAHPDSKIGTIRRMIDTARDGLLSRAKYPRNLFESCCAPV